MKKSLVLVGGGHAHIEVVRRWAGNPIPGVNLTVIDPNPRPVYSGMVPGFVAGEYHQAEIELDLEGLCARAKATFVREHAILVNGEAGSVSLTNGASLPYDVASIDVGSTVAGSEIPGVGQHSLASRPIRLLIAEIGKVVGRARTHQGPFQVHVIGAGAAGFELALCLEARLTGEGVASEVTIVTADERLLADGSRAQSRSAMAAVTKRKIGLLPNARVTSLGAGVIHLESGKSLKTDAILWVTGPAAHSLARDSRLPVNEDGFINISETLQVSGFRNLFAAGDCASLEGMKRAGVYAVRAAPLLNKNLRAALRGGVMQAYRPQSDFLSMLNLGDGTAIASKWGLAGTGRILMRIKDRIDRGFMSKYI